MKRSVRRAFASAVIMLAAAAAVALACGPGDLSDLTAGRALDAAVEADAGAPDTSVCIHASAPERPAIEDTLDTPIVVFAVDDIRFDTNPQDGGPPKPQGLDLDRTCTCLEPDSCIPPDSGELRACDGPDGRDNVAGNLLAAAATVSPNFGPEGVRKQIGQGLFSVLISIQGWNGTDDDPEVVAGVLLSAGSDGSEGDAARAIPKFDGTDVWTVTPVSVLGGVDRVGTDCRKAVGPCLASNVDGRAYVRGGVLVAHIDIPLPIFTATGVFQIDFVGATITGKISSSGGVRRLAGEIVGRWPTDRLLPSFARLRDPDTDKALCTSDAGKAIYGILKKAACDAVDLTANPGLDRTNAKCGALSNAVSYTAVSATIGAIFLSDETIPNDCPDFQDKCPD
jgi:hypothetical protein